MVSQSTKSSKSLRCTQGRTAVRMETVAMLQVASVLEAGWAILAELLQTARIRVSPLRFPLIRMIFLALLTQEQQRRFIHACSKDMCFNYSQITQLCADRPELASQTIASLFPNLSAKSSQLLLLRNLQPRLPQVAREVCPCIWLQDGRRLGIQSKPVRQSTPKKEGNLTGKFNLDLARPTDYMIAENCLLVNAWEAETAKVKNLPNVSQRGNLEMLRNEALHEVPFDYSREWFLPSSGPLKFDYSSVRRPPPMTQAMPEVGQVLHFLQARSDADELQYDAAVKLRALRAVSVHLYMSAQQFRLLIQVFSEGVHRQDFFCIFHTRVVDPSRLLSPDILHSNIFSVADRREVVRRVGHLQLLNPMHPEGAEYECNLAVYEERMVVEFLVQLALKEPSGHVMSRMADGESVAVRHLG